MKCAAPLLLVLGCSTSVDATRQNSDAALVGNGGSGGSAASGGAGGDAAFVGTGGSGGSRGVAEGGPCAPLEGGTGAGWSPMFSSNPNDCRTCVESLDAYCSGGSKCAPLNQLRCRGTTGVVTELIQHGCGYVMISYSGDVSDRWGSAYDEATGKVVYVWNNGRLSAGCTDAIVAGAEPDCGNWAVVTCEDFARDGGP